MRLIDGDDLKEAFYQKMKELLKSTDTPQISNEALSLLCGVSLITEAPTVEPERKMGRWLYDGSGLDYACSVCKKSLGSYVFFTEDGELVEIPNFCPNCGADMKGEDNDTNVRH